MRVLWTLIASWLVAGLLLAACGPAAPSAPGVTTAEPQPTAAPKVSIPLEDTKWTLVSLREGEPVAGTDLTLSFYANNYMEGTAGCNSYGVDYTTRGHEFHLAELHRTDFECGEPPGIMPQDEAFFAALVDIATYRATGDRLEFDNAEGDTILAYERKRPTAVDPALQDTEWLLTSLNGNSPLEGSRITLNLGTEGFEGYAGCNNYGGEYQAADGGTLLTSDIFHTLVDCLSPEGIMEQETAYLQALRRSATYRLADSRLEIANAPGETILVFARKEEFGTDPSALLGMMWRLVSIDGDSVGEGSTSTLTFYSASILGGRVGCGDYVATYQANGDDLNLLMEAMFDAACREEGTHIEPEEQFLAVVAPKADLRLDESQLEIYGERGGVLLFESLPEEAGLDLEGSTWSLLAFVGPNPYAEEPEPWPVPNGLLLETTIDLTFEGGAARGSAGCNSYGAAFSRAGSSLSFEAITVTEMACLDPAGVMEQETHFLELLAAVTGYHIYGDRLWLETDDGRALVFRVTSPVVGATPSSEPVPRLADPVLQGEGLGLVPFGKDAEAAIDQLTSTLRTPDFECGCLDPSLPPSEPLWPGCPGTTTWLLSWNEPERMAFGAGFSSSISMLPTNKRHLSQAEPSRPGAWLPTYRAVGPSSRR